MLEWILMWGIEGEPKLLKGVFPTEFTCIDEGLRLGAERQAHLRDLQRRFGLLNQPAASFTCKAEKADPPPKAQRARPLR